MNDDEIIDEIENFLLDLGFECERSNAESITYRKKEIRVKIELPEWDITKYLTEEEQKVIKKRLRDLGYL